MNILLSLFVFKSVLFFPEVRKPDLDFDEACWFDYCLSGYYFKGFFSDSISALVPCCELGCMFSLRITFQFREEAPSLLMKIIVTVWFGFGFLNYTSVCPEVLY